MRTSRLRPPVAALAAAVAAWLSQATIGLTGDGGSRLALLPLSPAAIFTALAAAAAVLVLLRVGASPAPLLLLGLVGLPLLPGPVPPPLLLWTGPLAALVWIAAALAMAASVPGWRLRLPAHAWAAALLAFVVCGAAAWRVAPVVPGGDEPHYLVITQSLLLDGDLRIENNHRRGDYRAYFAGDLSKPDYYRRGVDGEIYSVHAPGISALVLPAFALGGYRGVEIFLLLLSAAAAGLAWTLAYRVTGRADAAWFGTAAVALAPTAVLNSYTVYPDGAGALLVLTGVWALVRAREERDTEGEGIRPWLAHGAALALLPWLHTRFALLAAGLGALVLLDLARTRNAAGKASAFLAVPGLSALAWVTYFVRIYGTPDPAVPYRGSDLGSPAYIAGGLGGLLFDQIYGLLATAPVLVAAFAGLWVLGRRRSRFRALAWQLPFVVVPYALTVTHFAMWWGGYSSPARFLVAVLPALAVPAAAAWASAGRRGTRGLLVALLVATALMTAVLAGVDRGRLAYATRDTVYALWAEWGSRAADLSGALPAFFAHVVRGRPGGAFFAAATVWAGALAAAWLVLRALGERTWLRTRARLATATTLVLAAAAMAAATVVWTIAGASGLDGPASTLQLLRTAGTGGRAIAVDLSSARPIARGDLPSRLRMRIVPAARSPRGDDGLLAALPLVPAGVYRVTVEPPRPDGYLMAGIGRDQFALRTAPAAQFDGTMTIRFPVDVRALVIKGDEDARREVSALVLEPVTLRRPADKAAAGVARRAVRYGEVDVFFMDENSFPEPAGFWVGGARGSTVVLQPDPARATVRLQLRNAPVANRVTLQSGSWRDVRDLAPGEVAAVDVPADPARGASALTLTVASGFRPSDADPGSRDTRFLGVWVAAGE